MRLEARKIMEAQPCWLQALVVTDSASDSGPQPAAYVTASPYDLTLNSYVVPHSGPNCDDCGSETTGQESS